MSLSTIFINYRRQDSQWQTETLYKELLQYFDEGSIFKDFKTIEPGDDFKSVISQGLNDCGVLLVIIGKNWLDIKDSSGKRKLDNSSDFVRFEIATALKRGIRVIPVLFDDIEMPSRELLPDDIQDLCNRHAISIDRVNLTSDVDRLAKVIKKTFNVVPESMPNSSEQQTEQVISEKQLQVSPISAPLFDHGRIKNTIELDSISPRPFSKIDIILIWLVGITVPVSSILFFTNGLKYIDGIRKALIPGLVTILLGTLLITAVLYKIRPAKAQLLVVNLLILGVLLGIGIWFEAALSVVTLTEVILVSFLGFLIWERKYIPAQIIVLVLFVLFAAFTITFYIQIHE